MRASALLVVAGLVALGLASLVPPARASHCDGYGAPAFAVSAYCFGVDDHCWGVSRYDSPESFTCVGMDFYAWCVGIGSGRYESFSARSCSGVCLSGGPRRCGI